MYLGSMALTPDAIIGLVTLLVGLPPSLLLIYRWAHHPQEALEDEGLLFHIRAER